MNAYKNGTIGKKGSWLMIGVMGMGSASALAANPASPPTDRLVQGVVSSSKPLSHATIQIRDLAGNVLATRADATNERGYFEMTVAAPGSQQLVIEAKDGKLGDAQPFAGSLMGTVFPQGLLKPGIVHLNPATTLTVLYQQVRPGSSAEEAQNRVREFLGVPSLVDFGYGIENPELTVFSAGALEHEAELSGGWDRYTMELALTMSKDPAASHRFEAPQSLNDANEFSIAEELLKGVISKVGGDVFQSFLDGIGFPDKQNQILKLLDQVMARLAKVEQALADLAKDMKQTDYDVRAGALMKEYAKYQGILDEMKETDALAKAHPEKADQVKEAGKRYVAQILALGRGFSTSVSAEFNPVDKRIKPLQQIFAEIQWLKSPIINADYFKALNAQLELYHLLQAQTSALVADAQKVTNQIEGEATANAALKAISAEKLVYPAESLFTSAYLDSTIKGKTFLDRPQGLIWDTTYEKVDSCTAFNNRQRSGADIYKSPGYDQLVSMLNSTQQRGKRFSESAKGIGFSAKDADDIKMIVFGCGVRGTRYRTTYFNWFGNDQRGPDNQYYDSASQFSDVARSKGMGQGYWTMRVKPLR